MRPLRGSLLLLFALTTGLVVGTYWWLPLARPPLNVVLITLDTTRADRLPAYGYMDLAMPGLDRLAREGVVFDQAISVAPLTLPAHCSLFTGLFPPSHGVRDNVDRPLAEDRLTLAEILRDRGLRTGAFVGSVVLNADRGLSQGFEIYRGVESGTGTARRQRPANEVTAEAVAWLEEMRGARFFMWVHLYDPHRPYEPPPSFQSISDPYVGEIAFADSQIERLLVALEHHKLLERTIIVVAGDHGESLGEHDERDHGIFVYDNVVRIPLIVRAPGMLPGRVPETVRLVDVMPTVLRLLALDAQPADGVSLVEVMKGTRGPLELEAYSESLYPGRFGWSPLRALRDGRFKFIDAPRPELYDLDRDPFEQRNVYAERRALAYAMKRRLAFYDSGIGDSLLHPVSPELADRVASLGYIGRGVPVEGVARTGLPDPKDCIGHLATLPAPVDYALPSRGGCVPPR